MVSWLLDSRPLPQANESRQIIGDRIQIVSFVTPTELRYGAFKVDLGDLRRHRLERSLSELVTIQSGEELILRCAKLRDQAERMGHPLGQKIHEADRWVAATALELELELLSGDVAFEGLRGLDHRLVR
jgi:predicted nucleic acid-binding protein